MSDWVVERFSLEDRVLPETVSYRTADGKRISGNKVVRLPLGFGGNKIISFDFIVIPGCPAVALFGASGMKKVMCENGKTLFANLEQLTSQTDIMSPKN